MKVEIALDPSQLQSLASRVSAPPAPRNASGPGAGAGRGRGGRGGGKPRTARPKPKTAEELDAEMSVSIYQLIISHASADGPGLQGDWNYCLSAFRQSESGSCEWMENRVVNCSQDRSLASRAQCIHVHGCHCWINLMCLFLMSLKCGPIGDLLYIVWTALWCLNIDLMRPHPTSLQPLRRRLLADPRALNPSLVPCVLERHGVDTCVFVRFA